MAGLHNQTGCPSVFLSRGIDNLIAAAQRAVRVVGLDLDPVGRTRDQPRVAGQRHGQAYHLGPGVGIGA